MKQIISAVFICVISVFSGQSFAQQPITTEAAIDIALNNNLQVKNEKLKADYQKMLIASARHIAPINIMGEAGQINSFYTDTKISITQSLSFPAVYKRQKQLYEQQATNSFLAIAIKEAQLKKQVEQAFYQLVYLNNKEKLLRSTDSLYRSFLKRAELRLSKGETNLLEKATAENQSAQIKIQLDQLQADIALTQIQFQLLLNTTTVFTPDVAIYRMDDAIKTDTGKLSQHPLLLQIRQQQEISKAVIKVEQSKLLPDLIVGLTNTSIKGTGANDKLYSSSYRFTAVQAGVAIPLFNRGQKARIEAAKFSNKIEESNYEIELQQLQSAFTNAVMQQNKFKETVAYFESNSLKTAKLITTTANQQLANGNINYLEWVQLINHSIATQNEYIEAIKNLNDATIQLHYFTN